METMSDLVPSATMESSQRVLRALLRLLAPAIDAHHLVLAEMQQKAVDVSWVRFGAFVRSTSLIQCRCVWHQTDSCAHFLSPFFLRPRATVPKLVKTNPVMAYSIPVRNGAGARERGNED